MKKTKLLAVPVFAALMFTGCASTPTAVNKAPTVVGVKDFQCMVNSTIDFLDGVAALDNEDGDITPNMDITVTPHVEVIDGYAYFTEVGEYTVTYKITDSEGRTAQKKAYVDVVDRETYKTFNMPEGFSAQAAGSATIEKCGMVNGEFKLEVTGGEIAEDVKLTRTYTLSEAYSATDYVQYTFLYTVNSNASGKIKVLADGEDCAELAVTTGKNVLSFVHSVRKVDLENNSNVTIDICLGSLGDVDWTIEKVEIEYPQEENKMVERAEDFHFAGRVSPRIEDTATGNAYADLNENFACLEIDKTTPSIWLGGMFINTEITMKAGVTYTISFDLESKSDKYEIKFQNQQWDEKQIGDMLYNPEPGHKECVVTVTEQNAGSLWIYVQSGTEINRIKLSNLSVVEHLNATGKDTFAIEDFTEFHDANYNSVLTTENGGFIYNIEKFSAVDNHHTVTSPSFMVAGSCSNYVITFKAKATAPIEMIVAAPVYGGWDPTMMWSRVNITTEEAVYTFRCNGLGADRLYTIVWQFGSGTNQKYNDVKIEISDIKISLKNRELDG